MRKTQRRFTRSVVRDARHQYQHLWLGGGGPYNSLWVGRQVLYVAPDVTYNSSKCCTWRPASSTTVVGMKALVYTGPGRVEIQDVPRPTLKDGEVLLRNHSSGICGSDIHGFLGHSERRKPGLILGHET